MLITMHQSLKAMARWQLSSFRSRYQNHRCHSTFFFEILALPCMQLTATEPWWPWVFVSATSPSQCPSVCNPHPWGMQSQLSWSLHIWLNQTARWRHPSWWPTPPRASFPRQQVFNHHGVLALTGLGLMLCIYIFVPLCMHGFFNAAS